VKFDRRHFLCAAGFPMAACIASMLLPAGQAAAQSAYPDKPVRMIVGFAAGGPADFAARVVGDELSKLLGQPVLVENLAGGSGNLATERVVRAAPDGYTLLMATQNQVVTNPMLYPKLTFNTVKDLAPVSLVSAQENILVVNNDVPAKTVQELVALARAQPGQFTFASGGVGTSQHLAGELFKSMARIDIRHVSYRGMALAVPDLLAGRITMMFSSSNIALPQVREGKLRALAVTSLQRLPGLPDAPTVAESGFPGFAATPWFGLMAPAGTSTLVIERLHRETVKVLALPEVLKKFDALGMRAVGGSPAEFEKAIQADIPVLRKVIDDSRMQLTE
jgi:tripartite-type tricarboxylate transporter receptor subunit TctC